jgi:mRNA-degrading endonuclease toxin of MazEF toxin-antitoxin module
MKYKIVLMPFPFDDLSAKKVRPAICLTDEIKPYNQIVLAFITSRISPNPEPTDLVIDAKDASFAETGLKVSSMLRLHRLMTIAKSIILRELGELPESLKPEMERKLRDLFEL